MSLSFGEKRKAGRVLRDFLDVNFSTYADFAEMMDVNRSCVSQWMFGRVPIPQKIVEKLEGLFQSKMPDKKILRPDLYK